MKKIFFALLTISIYSIPVFADRDEESDDEGAVEFVGDVVENTAKTAVGAVVGTFRALGNIVADAGDDEEKDD